MYKFYCFIASIFISICIQAQQNNNTIDSLKKLLSSTSTDSLKVKYQIALGKEYLFTNPSESEKWFKEANKITITPPENNLSNKAYIANSLVQVNFVKGNLNESEKWLAIALQLADQTNNLDIISNAYLNAATVYSQTRRLDKAIPYCQRITAIYDSLNMPQKSVKALVTLGNIFVQLPKYDKALEYYAKAAALKDKDIANKDFFLLTAYNGMAYVHLQKRKYDSCLLYCNKAYEYALKYPQPDLYSNVLLNKATALEYLHKNIEVLPIAKEGMEVCIANNVNHYKIIFYAMMARAQAQNKKQDSAMYYAILAEKWMDSSNMPNKYVEMNNTWATVFNYLGDYKKAFEYKEKAYQANEDLKEAEVNAQTTAADAMYESSKKEKQIEYLDKTNKQQNKNQWLMGLGLVLAIATAGFAYNSYRNKRKATEVLEHSNKEKELFLKEIHHRVKNNLQIISSLLYMQFKDSKDAYLIAQLKQAQERIKSMSLVHNKLHETNNAMQVVLKEYIADLSKGILMSNTPFGKEISLTVEETQPINLSLDTSISLGLMLNELITNSCKYAFENKDKGNITISISAENNQYTLNVKDDGKGLPTDFEQKNSLGLRLVKNITRQLRGNVTFSNDNGTIVQICFPQKIVA